MDKESQAAIAAVRNGNVRTSTVAAVIGALVLFASLMAYAANVQACNVERMHELDTRVTLTEDRFARVETKLDAVIDHYTGGKP